MFVAMRARYWLVTLATATHRASRPVRIICQTTSAGAAAETIQRDASNHALPCFRTGVDAREDREASSLRRSDVGSAASNASTSPDAVAAALSCVFEAADSIWVCRSIASALGVSPHEPGVWILAATFALSFALSASMASGGKITKAASRVEGGDRRGRVESTCPAGGVAEAVSGECRDEPGRVETGPSPNAFAWGTTEFWVEPVETAPPPRLVALATAVGAPVAISARIDSVCASSVSLPQSSSMSSVVGMTDCGDGRIEAVFETAGWSLDAGAMDDVGDATESSAPALALSAVVRRTWGAGSVGGTVRADFSAVAARLLVLGFFVFLLIE